MLNSFLILIHKTFTFRIIIILLLYSSASLFAQEEQANLTYREKAEKIKSLDGFIYWDDEAEISDTTKPFLISVLGENCFGDTLENVFKNQTMYNKPVQINYLENINEITTCHILFISRSMESQLDNVLVALNNKPILTIADTVGFSQKGVHINFYKTDSKIPFEINLKAVKSVGLGIMHHLLSVVKITKQ